MIQRVFEGQPIYHQFSKRKIIQFNSKTKEEKEETLSFSEVLKQELEKVKTS